MATSTDRKFLVALSLTAALSSGVAILAPGTARA
jgi:hypothetical protein